MGLADRIDAARFRRRVARATRGFGRVGDGTIVHPPFAIPSPERVRVGERTYVLSHASILLGPGGSVEIGSRTYLGRDLTIVALGPVVIGDDVMGSDRLTFCDTEPAPDRAGVAVADQDLAPPRPVVVEDGVFLGTGAVVLPGVTIGSRSLVGAGAVVVESAPPNCVLVGNPARIARHFDAAAGAWVDGPPG